MQGLKKAAVPLPNGQGKPPVGGEVGITGEREPRLELGRFGERLTIEQTGADQLTGDFHENAVFPRL